jgi:hypothetical protein
MGVDLHPYKHDQQQDNRYGDGQQQVFEECFRNKEA